MRSGAVKKSFGSKFVMFGGGGDGSDLGMYKREALASDAAVQPAVSGFHGFTLAHVADSAEQVDQLLARAENAGGTILKRPGANGRGGQREIEVQKDVLELRIWSVPPTRTQDPASNSVERERS
jgi:Glyoxalase/Bleomycin resistance protein/Dioxygenase superfamily